MCELPNLCTSARHTFLLQELYEKAAQQLVRDISDPPAYCTEPLLKEAMEIILELRRQRDVNQGSHPCHGDGVSFIMGDGNGLELLPDEGGIFMVMTTPHRDCGFTLTREQAEAIGEVLSWWGCTGVLLRGETE